jgi:poly(3-hydroxybutyrate) depolymerase
VLDHRNGTAILIASALNDGAEPADALWEKAQQQLDALQHGLAQPAEACLADVDLGVEPAPVPRVPADEYRAAVERSKVYVAGLSAGGAAAAIMGATYPDIFAAIGVHSGLTCGAATDVPTAFDAMRQGNTHVLSRLGHRGASQPVPTIVFHGDRDTTVHPVNGEQVIAQAKSEAELQPTVTQGRSEGGMNYTRTIGKDQSGRIVTEHWMLHGCGHAWSGGSAEGSFTEPRGPDASREMMRFFLQNRTSACP